MRDHSIQIGPNVDQVTEFESMAIYGKFSNTNSWKRLVRKNGNTIAIISKGDSDLFTRIFVARLISQQRMAVFCMHDGDTNGYGSSNRLKYGVLSAYFYLNAKLSIPYAIRIGLSPFHLLRPSVGCTFLNDQKIVAYKRQIKVCEEKKTYDKLDTFDHDKELIENTLLNMIYNRDASGIELNVDNTIQIITAIRSAFTLPQLRCTLDDGIVFFEFHSQLDGFFLRFYDTNDFFDTSKFATYGVPSICINKFIDIFNASNRFTNLVMRFPVFNSRLNSNYVFNSDEDIQIIQTGVTEYFLILAHISPTNGQNVVYVYGIPNQNRYEQLRIQPVLRNRYPLHTIEYISLGQWFKQKELSGLLCCWIANLQNSLNFRTDYTTFPTISPNDLCQWFQNVIATQRV